VYGFYSVATDNAGNQEQKTASAEASTTLDSALPTSNVLPLPSFEPKTFTVSWTGNDGTGSGIAFYDVYVSDNGGLFALWQSATTATSASYTGVDKHVYGFYSVATDMVGNQEQKLASAEASTTVDNAAPSSSVSPLTPYTNTKTFTVSWTGSD